MTGTSNALMEPTIFKPRKSRRYKTPNFREKHMRSVTVDSEGRVFLFNEEASPFTVDERFHFFEEVLDPDDWQKVRAFYDLPKKMRRSNRSGGVRRHEGYLIGLYPKSPINVIQEERGKEAGEKSWRMPAYGKAFERMVAEDMAARDSTHMTDGDLQPNWPDNDEKLANPFEPCDDVPF